MNTVIAVGLYVGVGALLLAMALVAVPPSWCDRLAEKRKEDA